MRNERVFQKGHSDSTLPPAPTQPRIRIKPKAKETMKTSIQPTAPQGRIQPSPDSSPSAASLPPGRNPHTTFGWVTLLAGLLFLLFSAPSSPAPIIPPGCNGSGLGIALFTSAPDVHIGDRIYYSINVFNGIPNSGRIVCDAEDIRASIVTPDGVTNSVALVRTYLSQGQSDFYPDGVSYVVRTQDILPDGTGRNRRDFARLQGEGVAGDGMAVDAQGRVYVCTRIGVQVVSPQGQVIGVVPTPRPPLSVAFSGPDKKVLFITSTGALDANGVEHPVSPAKTIYKLPMVAQGFKGRAK